MRFIQTIEVNERFKTTEFNTKIYSPLEIPFKTSINSDSETIIKVQPLNSTADYFQIDFENVSIAS